MASPQLENGYTRIANEILEKLAQSGLYGGELSMCLVVFRKTYGFRKKSDRIPLSQFQKLLRKNRASVCRIKKSLVLRKILVQSKNGLSFNKNWEEWVVSPMILVSRTILPSIAGDTSTSIVDDTLKRKKETIQKKLPASRGKMKTYNEESYDEPVIDSETGEVLKGVQIKGESKELISWAEGRIGKNFANPVKQFSCIKKMKSAGFSIDQIKQTWLETESNDYWQEKGIDFGIVLMQISKGRKGQTVRKL